MKYLIGLLLLALAACTNVTAAVTTGTMQDLKRADAIEYAVSLSEAKSKRTFMWHAHYFASEASCKEALGNANAVFKALADVNIPVEQTPEFDSKDAHLVRDMGGLVVALARQLGDIPQLSAEGVVRGRPA